MLQRTSSGSPPPDYQAGRHRHGEEAGQAAPPDHAHHGLRVAALPAEGGPRHHGLRAAQRPAILGRGPQAHEQLWLPRHAALLPEGKSSGL